MPVRGYRAGQAARPPAAAGRGRARAPGPPAPQRPPSGSPARRPRRLRAPGRRAVRARCPQCRGPGCRWARPPAPARGGAPARGPPPPAAARRRTVPGARCRSRSPSPTARSISAVRARRSATPTPSRTRGSSTFWPTVRCGRMWKDWKTKPTLRAAQLACARRRRGAIRSVPPMRTVPLSGVSRPAIRLRSVDLPEPDSPMTATNSPAGTENDSSCRDLPVAIASRERFDCEP